MSEFFQETWINKAGIVGVNRADYMIQPKFGRGFILIPSTVPRQ